MNPPDIVSFIFNLKDCWDRRERPWRKGGGAASRLLSWGGEQGSVPTAEKVCVSWYQCASNRAPLRTLRMVTLDVSMLFVFCQVVSKPPLIWAMNPQKRWERDVNTVTFCPISSCNIYIAHIWRWTLEWGSHRNENGGLGYAGVKELSNYHFSGAAVDGWKGTSSSIHLHFWYPLKFDPLGISKTPFFPEADWIGLPSEPWQLWNMRGKNILWL